MMMQVLAMEAEAERLSLLEEYLSELGPKLLSLGLKLIAAVAILVIGSKLIRFVRTLIKKGLVRHDTDTGVVQFLDALVKYSLYFVLFLMILGQFGIQATSILAIAGSAGLTLGLALQGSLSNFAGGVLILVLKPFRVGDYIIEDTYKNEGTVEEIQLFYTTLKTFDNKLIRIPNATLTNASLVNTTASESRMLSIKVGVAYDTDLEKAKETMLGIFSEDVRVRQEPAPFVVVSDLADSSITLEMRGWVLPQDYWHVRWQALEEIILRFRKQNITIPYPQLDIHKKETTDVR